MFIPPHSKTKEGFEVTIGTNAIGTSYLTSLLLPLVQKSSAARIVLVSSRMVNFISSDVFERHLADVGGESQNSSTAEMYSFSKALNTMYAFELQKRINKPNVIVASVEPGFVYSDIQSKTDRSHLLTNITSCLSHIAAKSTIDGALPLLYVALSPDLEQQPALRGQMFSEGPNIQIFKLPSYINSENSTRAYDAIEAAIQSKL